MSKVFKRVFIGCVLLVGLLVSLAAFAVHPQLANMRSEYTTSGVIHDLDRYVSAHPGEWPKSWGDLGDGRDLSSHTRVRFDLTVADIQRDPALIYSAVMPLSGQYYTYPHAKAELNRVRDKVNSATLTNDEVIYQIGFSSRFPSLCSFGRSNPCHLLLLLIPYAEVM